MLYLEDNQRPLFCSCPCCIAASCFPAAFVTLWKTGGKKTTTPNSITWEHLSSQPSSPHNFYFLQNHFQSYVLKVLTYKFYRDCCAAVLQQNQRVTEDTFHENKLLFQTILIHSGQRGRSQDTSDKKVRDVSLSSLLFTWEEHFRVVKLDWSYSYRSNGGCAENWGPSGFGIRVLVERLHQKHPPSPTFLVPWSTSVQSHSRNQQQKGTICTR